VERKSKREGGREGRGTTDPAKTPPRRTRPAEMTSFSTYSPLVSSGSPRLLVRRTSTGSAFSVVGGG